MSISDLLTLCALAIAVYAILPKSRRLDISLRISRIDWLIIIVTFCLLNYLQLYKTFRILNWTPSWDLNRWGLNPNNTSYLLVLFVSIYLIIKASIKPLSKNKIGKFRELVQELSLTGQWEEIISLFEKHLNVLAKIYNKSFWEKKNTKPLSITDYNKIRRRLNARLKGKKSFISFLKNTSTRTQQKILDIISKPYQRRQEVVEEIFQMTLYRKQFAEKLSEIRPYLAFKIVDSKIPVGFALKDFVHHYLECLFFNTDSILYIESQKDLEIISTNRYKIPESNKLLYYLFNDATKAEKLQVWKPIGEGVINYLKKLHMMEEDTYNLPYDPGIYLKEKCRIHVAISYFRIMVSEALHQNIKYHMWLYYFDYFTKYICDNFNTDRKNIDPKAEFPNRYSRLLYEIISTLCGWIAAVKELPKDQENIIISDTSLKNRNENIVASSILALGRCIYTIVTTENIPEHFKRDRLESIFNLYFGLRYEHTKIDERYTELLVKSLLNAGMQSYHKNESYNSMVLDALLHYDIASVSNGIFKEALKKIVNHFVGSYGHCTDSKYVVLSKVDENTVEVTSRNPVQGGYNPKYKVKLEE